MATIADFKQRLPELKTMLGSVPGVVGVAIGGTRERPRIIVMVSSKEGQTKEQITRLTKDLPYEIVVTGEFKAHT